MRGRTPMVRDADLLALLRETGSIGKTVDASGYWDRRWVERRLRQMGVGPGTPGDRRRPENEATVADTELLRLWRLHGTISGVAVAIGHTNRDWVREQLRRLGIPPQKAGRPKRRTA